MSCSSTTTPEYLHHPPASGVPALVWTAPPALRQAVLRWGVEHSASVVNYETAEPPVAVSQTVATLPVFRSEYNWFSLP